MVKLIVFDFDGVISDNYELHYQMSRVQIKGLSREEHRKLFDGNIHVEREKLKDRNTGYDVKSHFSEAKKYMVVEPIVKGELERLAGQYELGIISSALEGGIYNFLERNEIKDLFSFVYGFESGALKIDKFKKIFREFDVNAGECVFVTDTVGDVKEGLNVGVRCVGVDFGYHERERFDELGDGGVGGGLVGVVSDFKEIYSVIERMI